VVGATHTLVLSRFILDEVERVLLYPRLQARYQITHNEAMRFTGNLADAVHMVDPVIVEPVILSDPADDAVLYTAADGKADVTLHPKSQALQCGQCPGVLCGAGHPGHDGLGGPSRSLGRAATG
jgi:predicted nucleic acid-binding protein